MNPSPEPTSTASTSDLLTGLLSDPQALNRISAMIRAATEAVTGDPTSAEASSAPRSDLPPQNTDSAPVVSSAAPTASTDGLAAILSDPAMLEKLPQMIAVMKPLLGSLTAPQPKQEKDTDQSPTACRNNLLLALKPFLSPHRRDAIDTMLRISHLGNVFSQLK